MFDKNNLDDFFNQLSKEKRNKRSVSEKLRLILPVVAIVLLAMLVLIPSIREDVKTFAFEITKPQDGELEKLMVENLNFYITDENNSVHNFKATHIEEVDIKNKITKIENIDGIYNNNDKKWFDIKTDVGYMHQRKSLLKMPNIVDMFYSDGFEMSGVNVISDFNKNIIYSKSAVVGDGFLGKIAADGFEVDLKTGVVTFVGNVKIVKSEEK